MVQPILSQDDLLDHDILGTPTDALQQVLRQALHGLMELDIAQRTGAERYERSEARRDQRNGTRPPRRFDTRMGSIDLEIPPGNPTPSSQQLHASVSGGPLPR